MSDSHITQVAEKVSALMQLDRMRHHVGTEVDMKVLANVPDYIASVFEEANAIGSELTPAEAYTLMNKRVSQIQAQLYLMRLELENRSSRDPAKVYEDPLVIGAYGERVETLTRIPKSFSFEPAILAYGWFPMETAAGKTRRWMRPGDVSVACVPHLGTVDQTIEITGYVLHESQRDDLKICVGETEANIEFDAESATHFVATLTLKGTQLKSANYVPIEFFMTDFRQPNDMDTRQLGANIGGFILRPVLGDASGVASAQDLANETTVS